MISKIQAKERTENADADPRFGQSFTSLNLNISQVKSKLANKTQELSPPVLAADKDNKNPVSKEKKKELTSPAVSSPEVAKPKETTSDTKDVVTTVSTT
jgi:hypothetical protein